MDRSTSRILVTGVTGFVGRRLIQHLERLGLTTRGMSRRAEPPSWLGNSTEYCQGDVFDPDSLVAALNDVDIAYYLIHSMGDEEDFAEQDRRAARNFVEAAASSGVRRIVYLSGLGQGESLSKHLQSRQEVGRILASRTEVECIELRAAVVIGNESLSFQMIQQLTERLPVMICPRWVNTRTQPIAIEDVIKFLDRARECPGEGNHVVEIGGADVVSYGDMIREYARQKSLKRLLIPVPFLTPTLSSLWLGLVTPTSSRVGRHLIDGLRNETIVEDRTASEAFGIQPVGMSQAITLALAEGAIEERSRQVRPA